MKISTFILLLAAGGYLNLASAEVRMPRFFSDNMVLQADTVAQLWGYATPGATVGVSSSWGETSSTRADENGKWNVGIRMPDASYDAHHIDITDMADSHTVHFGNVLAGEVWIASGQSNMDMPLRGYWHQPVEGGGEEITFSRRNGRGIRFLNVPRKNSDSPVEDIDAVWQESNPANTAEFSALAWFFARYLKDIIDCPVGIINTAYGGSRIQEWKENGRLCNAMICPLAGYTARGVIWNQGESNVGGHAAYPEHQKAMVQHWRQLWNSPDMQFYSVELPGWDYGDVNGTNAAIFRESQHRAAAVTPGAHIVCTSDLVYPDEADDIHARNKRDIGKRLAASAATYSYGIPGIPHRYPTYKSVDLRGDKALVWFNDMWQGFTPNENLQGFEVAGEDRVFYPAVAEIDRNALSITVSAPEVADIKAVRYCFKNFAIGKIHDMLGMPIVPFRTDDWEN